MGSRVDYIVVSRYILLLGPVLATLLTISPALYPHFTALVLLIVLNSQIRLVYLRRNLAVASFLVEVLLMAFAGVHYSGYLFFALLATLIDVFRENISDPRLASLVIAGTFLLLARRTYPLGWVIVLGGGFLVLLLFLLELQRERSMRVDTEALYDQLRRANYQLEGARARLLDYSRQVERVSQLEERNRIARELHDSLGHSLTGVLLQLDAAMQILPSNRDKGMELLYSVYDNINSSIETVRQTVKRLRPPTYQTHLRSLRELVEKFQSATGVNVELTVEGTPHQLLPSVETAFYRNTQEALTNAVRHGCAKNILINLVYGLDSTRLVIADDGAGTSTIKKGFGLSGMEERMELIGGKIAFKGDNGFQVSMSVPRKEG